MICSSAIGEAYALSALLDRCLFPDFTDSSTAALLSQYERIPLEKRPGDVISAPKATGTKDS